MKENKIEIRVVQSTIVTDGEDMYVEGLVNQTETWSHTLGIRKKFKEKICRGAFGKAITDATRIDFLSEHDENRILSTTDNNSLEIWEDEVGLKIRAKITPTSYGNDTYQLMKHGIIKHMSFGFRAISDKWKKLSDGTYERVVDALQLFEVSAVRNPAYPQSAISARGIELVEEVEIPDDCETEERNDIVEEVKQVETEERAYAYTPWSRNDVVNCAMEIVSNCTSLANYLVNFVGTDYDAKSLMVGLQHASEVASKIVTDQFSFLVDSYSKVDEEIKSEGRAAEDEEVVEEVREEVQETEKVTEERSEVLEEVAKDDVEKVEDTRSFDLQSFRNRVKERRAINEG